MKKVLLLFIALLCAFVSYAQDQKVVDAIKKAKFVNGYYHAKANTDLQQVKIYEGEHPEFVLFSTEENKKAGIKSFDYLIGDEAYRRVYQFFLEHMEYVDDLDGGDFQAEPTELENWGKVWAYWGVYKAPLSNGSDDPRINLTYIERFNEDQDLFKFCSNALWSGDVKDGMIEGSGTGIARIKNTRHWICFEGTFKNGFPFGHVKFLWFDSPKVEIQRYVRKEEVDMGEFSKDTAILYANGAKLFVNRDGKGRHLEILDEDALKPRDMNSIRREGQLLGNMLYSIDWGMRIPREYPDGSLRIRITLHENERADMNSTIKIAERAIGKQFAVCRYTFCVFSQKQEHIYYTLEEFYPHMEEGVERYIDYNVVKKEDFGQYLYDILPGAKNFQANDLKTGTSGKVLDYDCVAVRLPELMWSGSVDNGRWQGKGTAITISENKLYCIEGNYEKGIPTGDYKYTIYNLTKEGGCTLHESRALKIGPSHDGMSKVFRNNSLYCFLDKNGKKAFEVPAGADNRITDFSNGYAILTEEDTNYFIGEPLKYRVDKAGNKAGLLNGSESTFIDYMTKNGRALQQLVTVFNSREIGDPVVNLGKKGFDFEALRSSLWEIERYRFRDVPELVTLYESARKKAPEVAGRFDLVIKLSDFYQNMLSATTERRMREKMLYSAEHHRLSKVTGFFQTSFRNDDEIIGSSIELIDNNVEQDIAAAESLKKNALFPIKSGDVYATIATNSKAAGKRLKQVYSQAVKIVGDRKNKEIKEREGRYESSSVKQSAEPAGSVPSPEYILSNMNASEDWSIGILVDWKKTKWVSFKDGAKNIRIVYDSTETKRPYFADSGALGSRITDKFSTFEQAVVAGYLWEMYELDLRKDGDLYKGDTLYKEDYY